MKFRPAKQAEPEEYRQRNDREYAHEQAPPACLGVRRIPAARERHRCCGESYGCQYQQHMQEKQMQREFIAYSRSAVRLIQDRYPVVLHIPDDDRRKQYQRKRSGEIGMWAKKPAAGCGIQNDEHQCGETQQAQRIFRQDAQTESYSHAQPGPGPVTYQGAFHIVQRCSPGCHQRGVRCRQGCGDEAEGQHGQQQYCTDGDRSVVQVARQRI